MPRIFDNIEAELLPALEKTLLVSGRADYVAGLGGGIRGTNCI